MKRLIGNVYQISWNFVWVCAITLVMKYSFGHLEALTELYRLVETLGGQVKPPYE